jgi:hypothetical protein
MRRFAAIVTLALIAAPCGAWNDYGHRLIGAFVWSELTAEEQAKVARLIQLFKEDEELVKPGYSWRMRKGAGDPILEDASIHADHVRPYQMAEAYAPWHYADLKLFRKTPARNKLVCPNVTERIPFLISLLNERNLSSGQQWRRAWALVWLLHLAQDIHQPLHSATYYGGPFAAKGDRGGNRFLVKYRLSRANSGWCETRLHTLWDDVLELDARARGQTLGQQMESLKAEFPLRSFGSQVQNLDAYEWAKESKALSEQVAYRELRPRDARADREHVALSDAYVPAAMAVARRRAGLAGSRLTEIIRQALRDI